MIIIKFQKLDRHLFTYLGTFSLFQKMTDYFTVHQFLYKSQLWHELLILHAPRPNEKSRYPERVEIARTYRHTCEIRLVIKTVYLFQDVTPLYQHQINIQFSRAIEL